MNQIGADAHTGSLAQVGAKDNHYERVLPIKLKMVGQETMERICEPEIMDEDEQVRAYAEADFAQPHSTIIANAKELLTDNPMTGFALDLGCGPGDMVARLAEAFPKVQLEAVDGSKNMLRFAEVFLQNKKLLHQVILTHGVLPKVSLGRQQYDFIFSSSLLHHLQDPMVLWSTIKTYSKPGTIIFVNDLIRPDYLEKAKEIVATYSGDEPTILKRDFYNSLLAAFTVDEVKTQLHQANLQGLPIKMISDRHMAIYGKI